MPKETKLEEVLRQTLESLKNKGYSPETLRRYQNKFHTLNLLAQQMDINVPTNELFQKYLKDNTNKNTGEYSLLKERQRIRVINLIKSYITNGETDTSRKKSKSVGDRIKTELFQNELAEFVKLLESEYLQPNTICTYKRIVDYLLIYCEERSYCSIDELISGDIKNFILYLYNHNYFKPITISSALAGLKKFLSLYPYKKHLLMELPTRLPRSRNIIEIYNDAEIHLIKKSLSAEVLSKRDKAICLLLLETGLRAVDICNIKIDDIDWEKDIIYIIQKKTRVRLNLPLRNSYGNAIVDYLLNERPKCKSDYLFIRQLAPFTHLDGESSTIRVILSKMELLAGVDNENRVKGSRTTRHNAASTLLKSEVALSDISAILGHNDPNIVSVYLTTDELTMASCTLQLPGGSEND